ncbi:MAG: VWA domain-containing protein [Planctomycetales bacterium]|nr:VWA domain-containing protein [Planctomycetales bacterium]
MTFVLLIWCLAAVAIVCFYLPWRRRQTKQVATLWLWQETLQRKGFWSRWRRWASLSIQISLLSLMAVGLALPFWMPTGTAQRSLVVVMDVSASMAATDVGPNRFEQARSDAQRLVASLAASDEMAIFSAGRFPRLLMPFTDNSQALLDVLESLQTTRESADLEEAVRVAKSSLEDRADCEIWVLTDKSALRQAKLSADPIVRMRVVGGEGRNCSLVRLAARPVLDDPTTQEIFCEVRNHSPGIAKVGLRFHPDEQVTEIPFSVAAHSTHQHFAKVTVSQPVQVTAEIQTNDDLSLDNVATLRLSPCAKTTVYLIGDPPEPLDRVFRAVPGCSVVRAPSLPKDMAKPAIAIYFHSSPASLPPIPCCFFEPRKASALWEFAGVLPSPSVSRTERGRSILPDAEFESCVIEQAVQLHPQCDFVTWLESNDGTPLVWETTHDGNPVVVVQPILANSDLAFRPELPLLAAAIVETLASTDATLEPQFSTDLLPSEESQLESGEQVGSSALPGRAEPHGPPAVSWLLLFLGIALLVEWHCFHQRITE